MDGAAYFARIVNYMHKMFMKLTTDVDQREGEPRRKLPLRHFQRGQKVRLGRHKSC